MVVIPHSDEPLHLTVAMIRFPCVWLFIFDVCLPSLNIIADHIGGFMGFDGLFRAFGR